MHANPPREPINAEPIRFLPKGWIGTVLFLVVLIVAAESVFTGIVAALDSSKDLQWDEAKLLLEGIDPYSLLLDPAAPVPDYVNPGNLGLSQLPSSIVMFLPLAPFSFDTAKLLWIAVNVASTFVFIRLSCKLFLPGRIATADLAAITLLLISSTPWWVTLGNGQYGLFALALFMAALACYERHKLKSAVAFSCLASIKYTLVLPLFALFLPRKKDTALMVAAVLFFNAALTLFAGFLTHKNPLTLTQESLTIASSIAGAGAFDFFAFQDRVAPDPGSWIPALVSLLVIALTIVLFSKPRGLRSLSVLSIVSLVIVYHRIYDGVVLFLMIFHLRSLFEELDRPHRSTGSYVLNWLEFLIGCLILAYVFFIETMVYQNFEHEIFERIQNAFSLALYAYLLFLFGRSFRERRADMKPTITPRAT